MARKVEILNPVKKALESNESDDAKAKMILEALYNTIKMHQARPQKVVTISQSQTPSSLPTESVETKQSEKIIGELPKFSLGVLIVK